MQNNIAHKLDEQSYSSGHKSSSSPATFNRVTDLEKWTSGHVWDVSLEIDRYAILQMTLIHLIERND